MIVGVPLPSRERVKKSLSHRFLSISIRFIKADSELVGCAIEIHRWRLFPVSSGTCQEDSGKPAKELLKKQFSRRMWVLLAKLAVDHQNHPKPITKCQRYLGWFDLPSRKEDWSKGYQSSMGSMGAWIAWIA